jgi:hypothetical protein
VENVEKTIWLLYKWRHIKREEQIFKLNKGVGDILFKEYYKIKNIQKSKTKIKEVRW